MHAIFNIVQHENIETFFVDFEGKGLGKYGLFKFILILSQFSIQLCIEVLLQPWPCRCCARLRAGSTRCMLLPVLQHVPEQAEPGICANPTEWLLSTLLLDLPSNVVQRGHCSLRMAWQPGHSQCGGGQAGQWICGRFCRRQWLLLCGHREHQLLLLLLLRLGFGTRLHGV